MINYVKANFFWINFAGQQPKKIELTEITALRIGIKVPSVSQKKIPKRSKLELTFSHTRARVTVDAIGDRAD